MNMNMNMEDCVVPVFIVLSTLLIGGAVWAVIEEGEKWDTFKIEHRCKVVSKTSSSVANTYGTGSKGEFTTGVIVIHGKTGWLCDNGVTYYR